MPSTLCIHHAPCNDGAAAAAALAYILQKESDASGEVVDPVHDVIEVMPMSFGKEWDSPIDGDYIQHLGHHREVVEAIYIVDISLSVGRFNQIISELQRLGRIGETPPRVICIDHHQSAIERIEEIDSYCDETYIRIGPGLSGATLVWEYFREKSGTESDTPILLQYVADQDVWEWKLPDSKAVNAALNTMNGMMPSMYAELIASIDNPDSWLALRKGQGESILSVVDAQVRRAFGSTWRSVSGDGVEYMVVNATANSSEIGNRLCEDSEHQPDAVAMIFALNEDWTVKVSVRTVSGGKVTAREIAERFGGGGHDNAAGCRFGSIDEFRTALNEIIR